MNNKWQILRMHCCKQINYLDSFLKYRFLSERIGQSRVYGVRKVIAGFGHYCMNNPYKVSFTRSFARGFWELKHFVIKDMHWN